MYLALLPVRDGLDILVGLAKRGEGEFGIRKRLADIADSAPVKLFLLPVFELERGKYVDVADVSEPTGIAIFIHDVGESLISLYLQLQIARFLRMNGCASAKSMERDRQQNDYEGPENHRSAKRVFLPKRNKASKIETELLTFVSYSIITPRSRTLFSSSIKGEPSHRMATR